MKQIWNHLDEVQLNTLTQGLVTPMQNVVQGLTTSNRIGTIMNLSGTHFKGVLNNNSTSDSLVRFIVVGFPSNTGDPTTQLFRNLATGLTAGLSTVFGLNAMYYPLNKLDMKIYIDKTYKLAPSTSGSGGSNVRQFSHFVKWGGKKIEFKSNNNGPTYQNWMYASIWISADANDDTSVNGTSVELSMLERMYYRDA